MEQLTVPTKHDVNEANQAIFGNLEKALGFVPNLYAYFAKNDTALTDYLALQNRKSTLKAKEREVINLVVSQINECAYCLSAHTVLGKMNGFTDGEILEIRRGSASFDLKLDALVKFVSSAVINRSKPSAESREALFNAGYSEVNMIDIIMVVGDKLISNLMFGATGFKVDFPLAKEI